MNIFEKHGPFLAVAAAVIASCAYVYPAAAADELRVATAYKLMTLDPQYANLNENNSLLSQIYERLIYQDENLQLQPSLALLWRSVSDTTWEFKLRPNVKFHDGSAFTAEDVIYSVDRIKNVLQPPGGGFRSYLGGVKSVTASDPLTVVVETDRPLPNLPQAFASIFIMHRPASGSQTTEGLNAGDQPVGTGPYKFVKWTPGETLDLSRNEQYWGRTPRWPEVEFRTIENPAARVAALVTGEADLADAIPARDVSSLKQRGIKVASIGAARINFLQFDLTSDIVPGVTDKEGASIANPFRNPDVRRALSLATDRGILVDKILSGYGTAAAQFYPDGLPGTSSRLHASPPDYARAKALLAKAGYPDGFKLVLAGSNGRYPGDGESLQAIAQNWARIGIEAKPEAAPYSVFNTNRAAGQYGLWYAGCSGESVDIILDAVVASAQPERGRGSLNYSNYSNAEFDAMLIKAEALKYGQERDNALAEATDLVMTDQPIIPLYHFHHIMGYGDRVASYVMHPRGWTTAMQATPAKE